MLYSSKKEIEIEDFKNIYKNFTFKSKLKNSNIMITGFNGFLGKYIVNFLIQYKKKIKWKKLILIDSYILKTATDNKIINTSDILVIKKNLLDINLKSKIFENIDYVMHMASIASPHYYRKYPLETIEANVDGLKNILDCYKNRKVKILYFSSSEIYGDPAKNMIPTKESYNGNVSSIGPRSCYDESKRFCETLSYYYSEKYRVKVTIVRPFNNFGPGMKLTDKRLPADLANAVISNKDIHLYSDGRPKRSFCYISDAVTGYFQALTYNKFDIFNIGNDQNEISVKNLTVKYTQIAKKLFKYNKNIYFIKSKDKDYLSNNPNRRCPDISKARIKLNFQPKVSLDEGISKYLQYNYLK